MKRRLNEVYVKHTKKNYEIIEKTLDRDYFMTADQAKEFGLIDKVIQSRDEADGCWPRASSPSAQARTKPQSVDRCAAIWRCAEIAVHRRLCGAWQRLAGRIGVRSSCHKTVQKPAARRMADRVVNPILI